MPVTDASIPLSVALARLAREVDMMRAKCAELDGVVGPMTIQFDIEDPDALGAIQSVDRLTQEMTSLKPFIDYLSEVAALTEDPDASEGIQMVRLSSLRARLGADTPAEAAPEVEAGELDLF